MMQAADQIRKWWEAAKPALTWARAHTRLAMGALCFLVAAVWVAEHDARVKREVELGQMHRAISSEVSDLRRKAEGAIQESRANERVIRDLESRRSALEREASVLRARLNFLREEERVRVRPAVTPGHNVLAGRAPSRPDPAHVGIRDWGLGTGDSGLESETGNWKLETGGSSVVTGQRSVAPQWRPGVTADPQSQIQDFSESGAGVFNRQPSIDSGPLPHPGPEPRPAAQSAPSPELWSIGDLWAAGRHLTPQTCARARTRTV